MALLKIILYPEPVLFQVGQCVTVFDERLKQFIADLFETMYSAKGVGLAAPQVSVSERLFVMDCSGGADATQKIAVVNPEVIYAEGEQIGEEGCLSFPGIYQKVRRSARAIVRGQNADGEWFELDTMDLTARCVLHETDHCDGVVFVVRKTPLNREFAKRQIRQMQKRGEWK
jgi:peptide deformylase